MSLLSGVIGLDIGSQSCVISQAKRGGIDTVMDESSSRKPAMMVSFQGNERMVAAAALPTSKSNYKNTVRGFKRLIGRPFADPSVQHEISLMPNSKFFVELPNGDVGVKVNYNHSESIFSMEQVMAMLINKLRWCVNREQLPADVVLSVPGWWNEKQRRAMLDSCKIAGFQALRLLNDHTAAALSYGIYKSARNVFDPENQHVVMFIDIGATNMSVAIVGFTQGKLQVLSAAYDPNLGGRNFDLLIFEKFVEEFKEKRKLDVKSDPKATLKLLQSCEKAKQTLTPAGVNLAKVTVEYLMNEIDFKSELTLEDFEQMSAPLLEKLKVPIEQALKDSGLTRADIGSVEIIGGGTRPKIVKKALSQIMQLDETQPNHGLSTTLNGDESVARGCALNAAMLSPVFRVKEFNVYDTVAFPVTLTWDQTDALVNENEVEESEINASNTNSITIMQRNQSYPSVKRVTYKRNKPFEICAKYDLEENSVEKKFLPAGFNMEFAKFKVKMPTKKAEGAEVPRIRVDFGLDRNGLFQLETAESLSVIEEKKEEPKEEKKAEGEGEEAAEDDREKDEKETKDKEEKEDKKEPKKPVKKPYKKEKLEVESSFVYGLPEKELQKMIDLEVKFTAADKKIAATAEAKNELEAFIYSYRDKIDLALKEFVTESERSSFSEQLTKEENWLYDDGFDESKEEYEKRLKALQKVSDRFDQRHNEFQHRPSHISELKTAIANYKEIVNSTLEQYDHITEEERNKCRNILKEAEEWIDKQVHGQDQLGKHEDPVLTVTMLKERLSQLNSAARPIVNKKRPPPPKKEEKQEKMETEGATDEKKNENGEKMDVEADDVDEPREGMEVD